MKKYLPANSSVYPQETGFGLWTAIQHPVWFIGLVFVILMVVIGLFFLDWLFDPNKFRIREVVVHGQFEYSDPVQIRHEVESALEGNYFSLRLETVEQAVLSQFGVFRAGVRRRWPYTLEVHVDEIQPVARWGQDQLLDVSGELVPRASWEGALPELEAPAHLKDMIWQQYRQWQEMFAGLELSLDRLAWDERELWYLTLSRSAMVGKSDGGVLIPREMHYPIGTGVVVTVDRRDPQSRIERLIRALDGGLIADFADMESIDLRYPNGFAIRWQETAPALSFAAFD